MPTKDDVRGLSENLRSRSKLPTHVENVLNALPKDTHPMTQLSTAVLALQVSFHTSGSIPRLKNMRTLASDQAQPRAASLESQRKLAWDSSDKHPSISR